MTKAFYFWKEPELRVGGSPNIKLKGMAQRHGVLVLAQFGSSCWNEAQKCFNLCVIRLW